MKLTIILSYLLMSSVVMAQDPSQIFPQDIMTQHAIVISSARSYSPTSPANYRLQALKDQRGKLSIMVINQGVQADGLFMPADRRATDQELMNRVGYGATYRRQENVGWSGLKFGTDLFKSLSDYHGDERRKSLLVNAITKFEFVSINLFYGPSNQRANNVTLSQEKDLLELIARHTLARTAGQRLGQFGNRTIAGRSIRSGICERSGRVFGALREWCQAEGWSITDNTEVGYYTLRKGTQFAVVPLGAKDIKIGTTWHDVKDIVAMRDGKVYVTQEALVALGDLNE